MHLDDIRKVLQYCYDLQAASGPESAFRFSLFVGPRKKNMFATYPDTHQESEPFRRKDKDKGKQREDPLQGLLQMEDDPEGEPPTVPDRVVVQAIAPPSGAGPSGSKSPTDPELLHTNDLVRIDMGQMLRLRHMGYEVLGPVNGPNEGFPVYEVTRAILGKLKEDERAQNQVRPIAPERLHTSDPALSIDPTLLGQDTIQIGNAMNSFHNAPVIADRAHRPSVVHTNATKGLNSRSTDTEMVNLPINDPPTPPPTIGAEMAHDAEGTNIRLTTPPIGALASPKKTPKKRVKKRPQTNLSPDTIPQTRSQKRKKKVTDDDLAALEAHNMVRSGRRRIKPTRRT
jgi:hypothetical protein